MTTVDLIQHTIDELTPSLGPAEATSVARLLLEDLFGFRRGQRPRKLEPDEQLLAWTALNRLRAGEPVQYVTGVADFYGLQFHVTPAVLIPRPETEELVEWVLQEMGARTQVQGLDVGTGSGCIPLALANRRPAWQLTGVDVSEAALDVARANADRLGLAVSFATLDVLDDAANMTFASTTAAPAYDLIVANPPYIPPAERDLMGASTLAHEPALALFVPDDDPLLFYQRIGRLARLLMRPGGQLFFETNEHNNGAVVDLLAGLGFREGEVRKDLQGKDRMVRAVWPG